MKQCNVCKKFYNVKDFRKEKRNNSGYSNMCKSCHSKRNMDYVKEDSAVHHKLTRKYHKTPKGKEAVGRAVKKFYEKNK